MTEGQKALNGWEMTQAEHRSIIKALLAKAPEYPVGFFHEAEDGFVASRLNWGWSFEQRVDGRLTWAHLSKHDLLAGRGAIEYPERYLNLLRRAHTFLCRGAAKEPDSERERARRRFAYITWPAAAGVAVSLIVLLWWAAIGVLT